VKHQSFWSWLQHTDNTTHFKSKENLNFWSERPTEYVKWLKMVWVEFGCPGHGKGPWDGLGAMVKSKVTVDIMHGKERTSVSGSQLNPRPCNSPVKHTSFATPHEPSFGYYAQYRVTSVGRSEKGSTTVDQLVLRTQMTFHTTSEQDLNPRSNTVNDHPSVLSHEMMTIEPGENPTCILTWKPSLETSSLVLTMIASPYLCGRLGFVKVLVFPLFHPC
jgi:hypothetical protein